MDHPCYGRKMMYAPDKTRHYIKKDEVQKYLKLGWKLSNLEMRKLNVDKNNQAYGKKWIYISCAEKRQPSLEVAMNRHEMK